MSDFLIKKDYYHNYENNKRAAQAGDAALGSLRAPFGSLENVSIKT
jgi:hypothetical protein